MTQPLKILYADDDDNMRVLVKTVLEFCPDLTVHDYPSGAEAIRHAAEIKPDLILLDFAMPGMNGLETLARLQALPDCSLTPAIFITSTLDPERVESYYHQGAIGLIPKPFSIDTLVQDVQSMWNANRIVSGTLSH